MTPINTTHTRQVGIPCSLRAKLRPIALFAAASVFCSATTHSQQVFSDNFDSYSSVADLTAAGWKLSALNAALVTTTFPAFEGGKALRIQANPVPGTAPAVGMWYRMQEYTDFYVALDIASWPGTEKNQAVVLFGRLTDANTGDIPANLNPATAQGMICNYDTSQYGENPTDRRQGQFQINVVNAGFATRTIAVAEITFEPGRPYRLVFKCEGGYYTAQAYDLHDLTRPLVTLEAEDGTFDRGACGFLGFSRQGNVGTVDFSVDNYYCGPSDPNPATPPALAHPIPKTPQVVVRNPERRFTNFHPAAQGISFTATAFPANEIDGRATKLYLNGADVSAFLQPTPAVGTNVTFTTAPGLLKPNTVYSARIEVQDVAGTLRSVNTFWFDTFIESDLDKPPAKTIECEDYNYWSGLYQLDPIPLSGWSIDGVYVNGGGVGYADLEGTADIDFHDNRTSPENGWSDFRSTDPVGTSTGNRDIEDLNHAQGDPLPDYLIRQKYSTLRLQEYVVARTEAGEWLNYTRSFANTNYLVYLRVGSFGSTEAELSLVTSDPTQPDQTTIPLGKFSIPNNLMHVNYTYVPLLDAGLPAVVHLAGTNTIRLTMRGTAGQDNRKVYLNYLLFVPTSQTQVLPGIEIERQGNDVKLSWPAVPWRLQWTASLTTPVWNDVTTGITTVGDRYVLVESPTSVRFYRLVYP